MMTQGRRITRAVAGHLHSRASLVGYIGLDPRSRQSGVSAVHHGHISKQGSASARHVLCEAAHAAMRAPGPLRAFV